MSVADMSHDSPDIESLLEHCRVYGLQRDVKGNVYRANKPLYSMTALVIEWSEISKTRISADQLEERVRILTAIPNTKRFPIIKEKPYLIEFRNGALDARTGKFCMKVSSQAYI